MAEELQQGSAAVKRKNYSRKSLTLREKLQLIHEQETKGTPLRILAMQFGVGKTQVAEILKKKRDILKLPQDVLLGVTEEKKHYNSTKGLTEVNDLLVQFIKESQANHVQLTRPLIKQKAREIALAHGIQTFKASNGWLSSFYRRYGVRCKCETTTSQQELHVDESGNGDDMALFAYNSVKVEMSDYQNSAVTDMDKEMLFVNENELSCNSNEPISRHVRNVEENGYTSEAGISRNEENSQSMKSFSEKSFGESPNQRIHRPVDLSSGLASVGGLQHILGEITELVRHAVNPELSDFRVPICRGILLSGPRGTGKTLVAHAVAEEFELERLKFSTAEASSSHLRELHSRVCTSVPCLVLLDDIHLYESSRQISVLDIVTFLDSLNLSTARVFVIATTNRPDLLDPCLRHSGRLEKEFRFGLPDFVARQEILEILCRRIRIEERLDWSKIAAATMGFVGADL